jgi:hypothetical protein
MAAEYKWNHFVPVWMLNNFKDNKEKFYLYDKSKPESGIKHRNPENVFAQNNLYVQIDNRGKRDHSLESVHYNALDNDAKFVADKIIVSVRKQKLPNLSQRERQTWNRFVYQQFKRTPDSLIRIPELQNPKPHIEARIQVFEDTYGRSITPAERGRLESPNFMQSVLVPSLQHESDNVLRNLENRGLIFGRITKNNKSFVVGSDPVVHGSRDHTGFQLDILLPVAFDVVVALVSSASGESLFVPDDSYVRRLNRATFDKSTMIGSCSEALLKSLLAPTALNLIDSEQVY